MDNGLTRSSTKRHNRRDSSAEEEDEEEEEDEDEEDFLIRDVSSGDTTKKAHEDDEDLHEEELLEEEEATAAKTIEKDEDMMMMMEEDSELSAIKARVREMEEEAEKLKQLQNEVDRQMGVSSGGGDGSPHGHHHHRTNSTSSSTTGTPSGGGAAPQQELSLEEKMEIDARSVYVGNVDYGATAEELEQHFHGCGSINRVTILCNKYDGHPKGFAYIEFTDRDAVNTAMAMDESLFRARQIKVMPKRTNRPGLSRTERPPSYRGGGGPIRGRGFGRIMRGGGGGGRFGGRGFPRRFRGLTTRGGNFYSPY